MKFLLGILILMLWNPLSYREDFKVLKSIEARQLNCLVKNALHEAGGEGTIGRLLVTNVVFNRTENGNYCKTVYKYKQFSWTLYKEKKFDLEFKLKVKNEILEYYNNNINIPKHLKDATHFHATYVKPKWRKKMKYLGHWGNHHFYQER
jgi:spore germination cell wall hydrolase CwlJ-like protein